MNVIIVSDYANVSGGAAKVALESALGLAGVVDRVHVFAAIGQPEAYLLGIPNLEVTTLDHLKITEQPMTQSMIGGLWNKPAAEKLATILDTFDPSDTVVHIHSWRDALTLSIVPELTKRRFKFVITGHDYGLACPIAGFFDHAKQQVCRHRGLSVGCLASSCTGGSFVKKNWFVLRHTMQTHRAKIPRELRHFISLGELNEDVLRPYLSQGTKIHRLANPIPIDQSPRVTAEDNQGFVYVGRFSAEKAPVQAAMAAELAGVDMSFVGSGPEEEGIRAANPVAELLGWKSAPETQAILRSKRALVFPSIWYEGQPLVIDEVAALGVPVICSGVSAGARVVREREAGLIYNAGNIEQMANAMKQYSSDDLVRHHSQASYRAYWNNPQTMERHLRELLQVYSEVLSD